MIHRLALLLLIFGLAGCALGTQRFGRVIDAAKISTVKIGESSKQDVLDLFGPPSSYSRVSSSLLIQDSAQPSLVYRPVESKESEDVFTYEYREEHEFFWTALLYTYFDRDSIADTLMVFFDTQDKVKYMAYAKQTEAEVEDK